MSITKKATASKTPMTSIKVESTKKTTFGVLKAIATSVAADKASADAKAKKTSTAFKAGAKITALWTDGKRYAGKVHAVKGTQVIVAWADGTKPSVGERVKVA